MPHLELAQKVLGKRNINITGEVELLDNPDPYKITARLPYTTIRFGFYVASLGKRLEMFGNSIAFAGDALGAVDMDVLKQKLSYRDAFSVLLRRTTKINT